MLTQSPPTNWLHAIDHAAPLLGHRNWVVVADAAYPLQCASGIQTILADGDPVDALAAVIRRLGAAKHLRPRAYLDAEIDFIDETDAPGTMVYRERVLSQLAGIEVVRQPHEEILERLDNAGRVYNVLVIKTACRTPYTSVFFELDCGYWTAEAEARLRARMGDHGGDTAR